MMTSATTIFINGSAVTMDGQDRICEAVAVAGNKIFCVGSAREVLEFRSSHTDIIDLKGRTLIPGFVDAHCHAATYGVAQLQLPCSPRDIGSIEELLKSISQRASITPPGEWILGRGYNHLSMREKRHPTRWELDSAAPNHKVFLVRTCGHLAVANSRVLEEFDIGPGTPDPQGGKIDRDAQGRPTGLLYEQAAMRIRMQTLPSSMELETALKKMSADFLRLGITSLHDASGVNPDEIRAFQKGVSEGWIKVRLYLMVRSAGNVCQLGDTFLQTGLVTGFGNERIRLGPYKIMIDGAGSSGSAAMKNPYPEDPENYGILNISEKDLNERIEYAHRVGYQIALHAIGDKAIEMALDSYAKALARYPHSNHRHRIEHCGFLNDALLQRMIELEVIPALGLPFLYELGDNYLEIYDQKDLERAYPLGSLLKSGVKAALSSDAPVIHPNPMLGLYFALNHKSKSGRSIAPEQKVELLQALRAYTLNGAYASFEESIKGSLEVGKLADMVVLSRNILSTPAEELLNISVDLTMVDGEIVFRQPTL
jgi:predicted amidohydrolase YtcJ